MIRPDTPSDDSYESEIEAKISTLQVIVADSRWIVDLTALIAAQTAVVQVVLLFIGRLLADGLSTMLVCGIAATGLIACFLITPTMSAITIGAESILLRFCQFCLIPFDIDRRNVVVSSIWRALLSTVALAAIWGTNLFAAELIKSASFPQ